MNTTKQSGSGQDVTLQISAGYGPRECGWVVRQVLGKILVEAKARKISAKVLHIRPFDKHLQGLPDIETDAYRCVRLRLAGHCAGTMMGEWLGAVKWEGESPFRVGHKRKNWFVAVQRVEPESLERLTIDQLEREVRFDTMRSGGPGGQHVNKTSSAVWITHLPTQLKLRVEADRSQHRNRRIALTRLLSELNRLAGEALMAQRSENRTAHAHVRRGAAVRVFTGNDFVEKH